MQTIFCAFPTVPAADTATPKMNQMLDEVKWDMLNEWDRTKKAPTHARWMHDGSGKVGAH